MKLGLQNYLWPLYSSHSPRDVSAVQKAQRDLPSFTRSFLSTRLLLQFPITATLLTIHHQHDLTAVKSVSLSQTATVQLAKRAKSSSSGVGCLG